MISRNQEILISVLELLINAKKRELATIACHKTICLQQLIISERVNILYSLDLHNLFRFL